MEFLLAVQFLTRIPLTIRAPIEEKHLARAMAFFPLVGLLLGIVAGVFHTFFSYLFAPQVSDLFTLAFLVGITGNLHGDALMDTADALFSGRSREGMLEIMKDSRVGSHGVMAGCLALLAKFVLLGQLPPVAKKTALILMLALGRWAPVLGAAAFPYARTSSGVGSFTRLVGSRELFWASITVLVVTIALLGKAGLILAAATLMGALGLARYIAGKIGGMTGDTLGAMNECVEVLALLILQLIF